MSSHQRKHPGGAVESTSARKRSRLLPSNASGDLEESGTLSFEPAGEEIIHLTGESPEPEVINTEAEPEVINTEALELNIIVVSDDESAGDQSQQQPHFSGASGNSAEPLARDDEAEPRENDGAQPASVYSSLWLDANALDWVQSPEPSHLSRSAENSAGLLTTVGEEEPQDNDGALLAGPATPPAREDDNSEVQDGEQRQLHPLGSTAADNSVELRASANEEETRDTYGSIDSSEWPETVESSLTWDDENTEDREENQQYTFGSGAGGNSPELVPSNLLQEPRDTEFSIDSSEWPETVESSLTWDDENTEDREENQQYTFRFRAGGNLPHLVVISLPQEPRNIDFYVTNGAPLQRLIVDISFTDSNQWPETAESSSAWHDENRALLEVREQQRRNVTLNGHEQVDSSAMGPEANDAHVADPSPAEQESDEEHTSRSDAQPTVIRCPICLEFYSEIMQNGEQLLATLCGHVFCSRCLPIALENSNMCPTCREELDPCLYIPIYL